MYNGYYPNSFAFFGTQFFNIIFWVLIVWAIIFLVRHLRGGSMRHWHHGPGVGMEHESALDILKKRYAKGELTKDQFEIMKRDIV